MVLALGLNSITMMGEVRLPAVIADNMVLQRNSEVKLWGKATPGHELSVKPSWAKKAVKTTAENDSTWVVTVSTPEAGGPYSIDFAEGKSTKTVSNVLIGEVWFCTGQSNMEMPLGGFERQPLKDSNDMIARAKKSTPVRMFVADSEDGRWVRQYSKTPKTEMWGKWLENTPENASHTSATAYYFARYLQEVLDVPVGIMISSLGGSQIECWLPREVLAAEFPEKDLKILDNDEPIKVQQTTPSILYNAKVNPLINYGVRGFLWYQGESNRHNADRYADLMAAYARTLRSKFGNGEDMPFYFVEIAPYNYGNPLATDAALLREAQADAVKKIPNSGIASTIDIGNFQFIHPVDKATVGQRLAWLALDNTYGIKGIASRSPQYDRHEVTGDGKMHIFVTETPNNICPMWTDLQGFEIAGEDGVYHQAKAQVIDRPTCIELSSPDVPEPKYARYAFHNFPEYSVYSGYGLPLLPFRTDRSR